MKNAAPDSLVPKVAELIGLEFGRKFAPYQRMAGAIIDLTKRKGRCEPADLLPLGFTRQETLDLWHMAHAMVSVELRLMALRGNRHA